MGLREKVERLLAPENFGPASAGLPTYTTRRQKLNPSPSSHPEQSDDFNETDPSEVNQLGGAEQTDGTVKEAAQPKQMRYWGPRTMVGGLALYHAAEYDPTAR